MSRLKRRVVVGVLLGILLPVLSSYLTKNSAQLGCPDLPDSLLGLLEPYKNIRISFELVNRTNTTATLKIIVENQDNLPRTIYIAIGKEFVKLPWDFEEDPELHKRFKSSEWSLMPLEPVITSLVCADPDYTSLVNITDICDKYLEYYNKFVVNPRDVKEIIVPIKITGRVSWISVEYAVGVCMPLLDESLRCVYRIADCYPIVPSGCECSWDTPRLVIWDDKLVH